MENVTQLAKKMQAVLQTKANELVWETGFMDRQREITGSSFVTGLVSAWQANPQVSLAGLSQAIGNAGTPVSRQAVHARFDETAVAFMAAMAQESLKVVVKGTPVSAGLLARFTAVELTDSSLVTLPNALSAVWRGSGGFGANASTAAIKLSVRWNMCNGQLQTLDLSDGIQHDRQSAAHHNPVAAGSLQIKDLGYFKIDDFVAIEQQDAYWLSRYKLGTCLLDANHQRLDLLNWLPQQVGQRLDTSVYLGHSKRLLCRLVAERVPSAVVRQRHERIRETARQNQKPVSQQALAIAHWTIYLTNVPPAMLTPDEVFILGRYRWQIELLFKLWKQDLQIDKWRTTNPCRILCELYAKLIAAIVTHWLLLVGCWHNERRSLRQAMPTIRGLAWQWANSLANRAFLIHALQSLCRALSRCQLDCSRSAPRHFQLLGGVCA
jgi:hypothetical protein